MTQPILPPVMRDAVLQRLIERMRGRDDIFFLSGDFGSPVLDRLRQEFPSRFINVGIAEQSLINVSCGLAMEGFTVFAYAIAPFFLRAFEQIRINLSLHSHHRKLNVNLVAVGAGASYDVAGPTHHCFEDLAAYRLYPHMQVFSPSDATLCRAFVDRALAIPAPKYLRLDGKRQPVIYREDFQPDWDRGFHTLREGVDTCLVSTGCMTHIASTVADALSCGPGVVDVFMMKPLDLDALGRTLCSYRRVVILQEAFTGKGGLDHLVLEALHAQGWSGELRSFGLKDSFIFVPASREVILRLAGLDSASIIGALS
ncbi:MAG: transketolase [Planctomycetes bacterium]|nr:transketolase [Planctomycetota bacterium]